MRSSTIPGKHLVSSTLFDRLVRPLAGLKASYTWRGAGSAIFIELGKLTKAQRSKHPKGEASIMLEWSWRIESVGAIVLGSWSSERKITTGVQSLKGRRLVGISLAGRLPELSIALSGGRWVHSFMTAEGQPEWTVFLPDRSWLHVKRGRIVHDLQNVSLPR